jgi:hypothetical protein
VLLCCFELEFVARVGRSVVTMRPWQTRVGILGSEFGAEAEFIIRKEFLSAPIHSPLSGRLIGPTIGIKAGYGSS